MTTTTKETWPYYRLPPSQCNYLRPDALARLPMKFYSSLMASSSKKPKIPWILVSLNDRSLICRAVPSVTETVEYVEASSNMWIFNKENNEESNILPRTCTLSCELMDKPRFAESVEVELERSEEEEVDLPNFLALMRANLVHKPICIGMNFTVKAGNGRKSTNFIVRSVKKEVINNEFALVAPQTSFVRAQPLQSKPKDEYSSLSCPIGLEHPFSQLSDLLDSRILEGIRSIGQTLPRGILMTGPPGVGKTFLVRHIAANSGIPIKVINGPELISAIPGESEANLMKVFDEGLEAARGSPNQCSIIFFDEIDAIARKRELENTESISEIRLLTRLLTLLDGFDKTTQDGHVIVFAATNRPNALDPAMRRPGRFDREIVFEPPDSGTRSRILKSLMAPFDTSQVDFDEIGRNCIGYVSADLAALVQQIILNYCDLEKNSPILVSKEKISEAMKLVGPSLHRQYQVALDNRVTWQDIAGIDEIKDELRRFIEWPLLHADAYKRMGLTAPRGVLLYGPPGCSKTTIAKAIANESGFTFFSLNGAALFSCYVGESEQQIRNIFQCARMTSPSVIFYDEIDAIVGKRSSQFGATSGGDSVQERILSTLLNEIDGISSGGSSNVLVIGATNRRDMIDDALLRPGRFDRHIYIPLPSEGGRKAILELFLKGRRVNDSIDISSLAARTEGYSGADLKGLVQEAGILAMHDESFEFCMPHFEKILETPGRRRTRK